MQVLSSAVSSLWRTRSSKRSKFPETSQAMFSEEQDQDQEQEQLEIKELDNDNNNTTNDNNTTNTTNNDGEEIDIEFEETIKTFDCIEEELQYLRRQNLKLKEKLKGTHEKNGIALSGNELADRVQQRLPEFIKKADFEAHPNVVFIPSEIEGDVGVIDKEAIDWWSVVDLENPYQNTGGFLSTLASLTSLAASTSSTSTTNNAKPTDELIFPDAEGLEGPYVAIREGDVVDSIAYFVAQCVVNMPESHGLTHEEMLKKLDKTFAELREKNFFHRMYDWGMLAYTTYGWTQYAWSMYQNPWMAKMVSSCFWTAACWLILV